jgi:aminoglycoside phosphotransferase (APT) family kinase protein
MPPDLLEWVQSTVVGDVTHVQRHLSGASRQAWSVDIARDGTKIGLFVLRDALGGLGGSVRDGAILSALATSPIPVPEVYAVDERLGAVLLERVEGRDDFHGAIPEEEREAVCHHLMRVAADLHALEPTTVAAAHLGLPSPSAEHGGEQLAKAEAVAAMLGDDIPPVFLFALAWLRRNVPTDSHRTSLVHSDLGPGNLLHRDGRIVALLDWEVAHWGDGMEDLAALSVRDMATPVGHLPTLYRHYEAASGDPVNLSRVRWYRVLVLTRNAMLITVGLRAKDDALDRAQLTMFNVLLMRADALALCDAMGVERPTEAPLAEGLETDDLRLVAHAWSNQRDVVVPAVDDLYALQRAQNVGAILGYLDHEIRFRDDYRRREFDAMAKLLKHPPADDVDGYGDLRCICEDLGRAHDLAVFFARHLLRRGMLYAPLLGPLADRLPQRLEDA